MLACQFPTDFLYEYGFSEKEIFWGYEDYVDILGGSSQNWTCFRGHFYAFMDPFLRSSYIIGIFLGVAKISNILEVLDIPDVFGG